MGLPQSEPLPENINELPPARQRHIRRQPRSASLAERQLLLDSVLGLTAPNMAFFTLSLLGSLAAGAALYFDDPAVLVIAIVLMPFLKPAFALALLPASRKTLQWVKSLISLLILLSLIFAGGLLAGWLKKEFSPDNITMFRFSAPYWLDLAIVATSTVLGVFMMVRKGSLPRLVGVILAYEILFPLTIAGFSFSLGTSGLFPGALWVSLTHLGLAILLATMAFFTLGFMPKNAAGWLFLLLPSFLVFGGLLLNLSIIPGLARAKTNPTPTTRLTSTIAKTTTPEVTASPTATPESPTHTATQTLTHTPSPSKTPTPTPTQTPTQTQTPEPTTYWAIVDTLSGAVIRESPNFDAPVAGYLNNGDTIEVRNVVTSEAGSQWYWVSTPGGQEGWLLASLVNTQTPTPASTQTD
jgi:uncharacterized membrane protein